MWGEDLKVAPHGQTHQEVSQLWETKTEVRVLITDCSRHIQPYAPSTRSWDGWVRSDQPGPWDQGLWQQLRIRYWGQKCPLYFIFHLTLHRLCCRLYNTEKHKPLTERTRTMLDFLIALIPSIVGVLYAIVSICYVCKGDWAWATVWGAYALANLGLVLAGAKH